MIQLHMTPPGKIQETAEAVNRLMMPPRMKRLYLARLGRMLIAQTKQNVKRQVTINGTPMTPRKRKPTKERPVYRNGKIIRMKKTHQQMFYDLVHKSRYFGVKLVSDLEARAQFFHGDATGQIAFKHQHGKDEFFSMSGPERRKFLATVFSQQELSAFESDGPRAPGYWEWATQEQAEALIAAGIQESALVITRTWHKGDIYSYLSKNQSWNIPVPARPFLGISAAQRKLWGKAILQTLPERFRAKNFKHLLN